jgi:hypothetical protein
MQENFGFLIAKIFSTVDASQEEGAGRLNRYIATVPILTANGRTGAVEYFDRFPGPALITQA